MPIKTESTGESQYWYVMRHLEPSVIEKQLRLENDERFSNGRPPLHYIIPFRYLTKVAPLRKTDDAENAPGGSVPDKQDEDIEANNSLREHMHDFVFIMASETEISELLHREWNRSGRLHLRHYRTHYGTPIRIGEEEMRPLIQLFVMQHQRYAFTPYDAGITASEQVHIMSGIFKDYEASVIEVHHTADGVNLTLGIPVFNSEAMLKLYDYPASEVQVVGRMENLLEPCFVQTVETDLLDILRRRIMHRDTVETRQQALDKLSSYGILHYLKFDDGAVHNHFQALMLLCATLRRDKPMRDILISRVGQMLQSVEAPASDEEAFLLAILFVATRKVDYCRTARQYCQTHNVTSQSLKRIMPLVKKMSLR